MDSYLVFVILIPVIAAVLAWSYVIYYYWLRKNNSKFSCKSDNRSYRFSSLERYAICIDKSGNNKENDVDLHNCSAISLIQTTNREMTVDNNLVSSRYIQALDGVIQVQESFVYATIRKNSIDHYNESVVDQCILDSGVHDRTAMIPEVDIYKNDVIPADINYDSTVVEEFHNEENAVIPILINNEDAIVIPVEVDNYSTVVNQEEFHYEENAVIPISVDNEDAIVNPSEVDNDISVVNQEEVDSDVTVSIQEKVEETNLLVQVTKHVYSYFTA